MTRFERFCRRQPFIVCMACSIHITWGLVALFSPEGAGSTAVSGMSGHQYVSALLFLSVGAAAFSSLFVKDRLFAIALTVPQQLVLAFSADAAGSAIWLEHYADGTIRPWEFILDDQNWALYLCLWHAMAVGVVAWRGDDG